MPFAAKYAFRSLLAKRRGLARLTAWLAVGGIAAGVGGMIFADALARGFAGRMESTLLRNLPHVSVYAADGAAIDDWRSVRDRIASTAGVVDVVPTNFADAVVAADGGTSYALVKSAPRDDVATGSVLVGARLAETLKIKAGDEIEIVTMATRRGVRTKVAGAFTTGVFDYDSSWIACSPATYALLVERAEAKPNVLAVSVADVFASDRTAASIRASLGDSFRVVDWQEANRPLFAALATERRAALVVIGLVVLFAAFNITTTMHLRVAERRLDIAVLKTCGARPRAIVGAFLIEGMALGALGVAAGVILGVGACLAADRFGLLALPPEVYSLEQIPLAVAPASAAVIALAALTVCLLATTLPALAASRVGALENLRRQ